MMPKTLKELQEKCRENGLPPNGTKEVLRERLWLVLRKEAELKKQIDENTAIYQRLRNETSKLDRETAEAIIATEMITRGRIVHESYYAIQLNVRSRFLSVYKRDYLKIENPEDSDMIDKGYYTPTDGNVKFDAILYKKKLRTDESVFEKLYGITWRYALILGT
jgi:SAP domain